MQWLTISMSSSFNRAPNSDRATIAKVIFISWVDIDGAATGLSVEISERLGKGVLHN